MVEDTVIVDLIGMVIVDQADIAEFLCLFDEFLDPVLLIHDQSHLKKLVFSSVFLRTDIGDVEVIGTDQFQYRGNASRFILELEFEKNDASVVLITLQITDGSQFFRCF